MIIYSHPKSLLASTDYKLSINGQAIEVLATGVADYAICSLEPADFPAKIPRAAG